MKKKLIAVSLMFALLVSLNSCGNKKPLTDSTVDDTSSISVSDGNSSSNTASDSITQEETENSEPALETDTSTVSSSIAVTETDNNEKTVAADSSSKPTEEATPEVVNPPTTSVPDDSSSSTPEQTPVEPPIVVPEPEPQFDIDYWISYAKDYAVSIGLGLDSTAVSSWDNPIAANPKRTGLESDIISRLNGYKNIEGFSSVWVWAVKTGENQYELYIGYA